MKIFSFWCIACRHMGQPGTNVNSLRRSGAHLIWAPALNSWFGGFSEWDRKWGQRERIVRHWFAVKNSDRRSFQRRSGRSKAWLAESGREGRWYHRLSFHSQTSVKWLHLLCGLTLDTIINYCILTLPSSLTHSYTLAATGQKPLQLCPNNTSVRYGFVYLLDTRLYYLHWH